MNKQLKQYFLYYCILKHLPQIHALALEKCDIGIEDYMRQKRHYLKEKNHVLYFCKVDYEGNEERLEELQLEMY